MVWAVAALETSSNQPVLPHVIIALNASENNIDEELWDPEVATSTVLDSLSRTVFKNTTFKKHAQFWRERKRPIETVSQLIRSYYSSIKVDSALDHLNGIGLTDLLGRTCTCTRSSASNRDANQEIICSYSNNLRTNQTAEDRNKNVTRC